MTLKNPVKPVSKSVLVKLGSESHFNTEDDDFHSNSKSLKRKAEIEDELERVERGDKQIKKERRSGAGAEKADKADKKKEKKSAADRREELLKQLKAVENAIAKKRTKINSER